MKYFPRYPLRSVWRICHYNVNPCFFDTIHVNEFPKSGGTWLARMISECTQYRFDDNLYPWFGNSVVKHHKKKLLKPKMIQVVRDPRDVYVSLYFHCKKQFSGDGWNHEAVKLMKKHYFDIEREEKEEINYFVNAVQSNPIMPPFSWQEFYLNQNDKCNLMVKYEELRADPANTLKKVFSSLGLDIDQEVIDNVVDKNNIDKILEKRKNNAKQAHFIRRGKVSGYKTYLLDETVDEIEKNNLKAMQNFGYL